jgi:hypothetical protein
MPPTEAPQFGKSPFQQKPVSATSPRLHWARVVTPQAGNRKLSGLVPNRNPQPCHTPEPSV